MNEKDKKVPPVKEAAANFLSGLSNIESANHHKTIHTWRPDKKWHQTPDCYIDVGPFVDKEDLVFLKSFLKAMVADEPSQTLSSPHLSEYVTKQALLEKAKAGFAAGTQIPVQDPAVLQTIERIRDAITKDRKRQIGLEDYPDMYGFSNRFIDLVATGIFQDQPAPKASEAQKAAAQKLRGSMTNFTFSDKFAPAYSKFKANYIDGMLKGFVNGSVTSLNDERLLGYMQDVSASIHAKYHRNGMYGFDESVAALIATGAMDELSPSTTTTIGTCEAPERSEKLSARKV